VRQQPQIGYLAHSAVGAGGDGGDEEGQNVHHGVDLAGDTHVEEDDGADEHAEEANEEKVTNRVGVVIGKGDGGSVLVILEQPAPHLESCHLDGDLLRGSNQNGSEEPIDFGQLLVPTKSSFRGD